AGVMLFTAPAWSLGPNFDGVQGPSARAVSATATAMVIMASRYASRVESRCMFGLPAAGAPSLVETVCERRHRTTTRSAGALGAGAAHLTSSPGIARHRLASPGIARIARHRLGIASQRLRVLHPTASLVKVRVRCLPWPLPGRRRVLGSLRYS